jgi:hypothetical protein
MTAAAERPWRVRDRLTRQRYYFDTREEALRFVDDVATSEITGEPLAQWYDRLVVERNTARSSSQGSRFRRTASSAALSAMVRRGESARQRFLDYASEHGGLTRGEAERVLEAYLDNRVIRLDHATGQFHVRHGALLDPETLRRMAEES